MGGWGIGVKTFWKKSLLGQEGKKTFHKKKNVHIEIYNIINIYSQSASEMYFLDF